LEKDIAKMTLSLDQIKFGGYGVPAPVDDDFLASAAALQATWPAFEHALHGVLVHRRLAGAPAPAPAAVTYVKTSVPELLARQKALSAEAAVVMDQTVAKSELGVPGARMKLASRQVMLANEMVKEALLLKYGYSGTNFAGLNAAAGQFSQALKSLQDGGDGVPEIIKQRDDLIARTKSVDGVFAAFKAKVDAVAKSNAQSAAGLDEMKEGLDDLQTELDLLMVDLEKEDPVVEASFGWTRLIYLAMVMPMLCFVMCAGVYAGGGCSKAGSKPVK
jgi:hypothetical protein